MWLRHLRHVEGEFQRLDGDHFAMQHTEELIRLLPEKSSHKNE
jgi:surfactin synthase thioesterase subunit